jgi:phosphoglycerate dehydrogenase-like enzyme
MVESLIRSPIDHQLSMTRHSSKIMKSRIQRDPSIGVIGLGIMGSAIARHVIQAGYRVSGYDVRALRLRHLRAAGGTAAKSAGDVG